MTIFLVYSTSSITSGKKSLSRDQNGGPFQNFEIPIPASIDLRYKGGLKVGLLYSFINETTKLFMMTKKTEQISSLNFLCIIIMRL